MVDFNNETTVAVPPSNIMKILVIQKREYLLDAWENYYKKEAQSTDADKDMAIIKSRLKNLFLCRRNEIERKVKKEIISELLVLVDSNKINDLLKATELILEHLDNIGLSKIDTREIYDRTIIEKSNIHHGAY